MTKFIWHDKCSPTKKLQPSAVEMGCDGLQVSLDGHLLVLSHDLCQRPRLQQPRLSPSRVGVHWFSTQSSSELGMGERLLVLDGPQNCPNVWAHWKEHLLDTVLCLTIVVVKVIPARLRGIKLVPQVRMKLGFSSRVGSLINFPNTK